MTQVNIKKLDSLTHNDTAATKLLNDNFQAVKKALEDSLSRTATDPNYMDTDLDMNTRKIINVAKPTQPTDIVNKKYVDETVGNAAEYAKEAKEAADRAETYSKRIQNTNKYIQDKTSEANEIYKDIVEIGNKVAIKDKYTPYTTYALFSKDDWIEEILGDGKKYLSNVYKISIRSLLQKYEIKSVAGFVNFLRPEALDGSYLSFAQVFILNDPLAGETLACKIFKKGAVPESDVQPLISLFFNLEEK